MTHTEKKLIEPRTEIQTTRLTEFEKIMREYNGYRIIKVGDKASLFDMSHWRLQIVDARIHVDADDKEQPGTKGLTCDTACCAWGIACIHPKMVEMGLDVVWHEIPYMNGRIDGKHERYIDQEFFGLTSDERAHIWFPERYKAGRITPEYVADHIKEVLNGKFRQSEGDLLGASGPTEDRAD